MSKQPRNRLTLVSNNISLFLVQHFSLSVSKFRVKMVNLLDDEWKSLP